jgi:hypothetical protein
VRLGDSPDIPRTPHVGVLPGSRLRFRRHQVTHREDEFTVFDSKAKEHKFELIHLEIINAK